MDVLYFLGLGDGTGAFVCPPMWTTRAVSDPPGHRVQGGIFATDGSSPWGSANRVFVKYCSSDFWSGDTGASSATYGYNFRGARIVAATITDLLQNRGMDAPGQQLLFGGCSAGAIGAMNNLESVAGMLPPTVTMRGFLDAAALLDIQPAGWPWSAR